MAMEIVRNKKASLSELDYTCDLLTCLSNEELEAVQKIALVFINKNKNTSSAKANDTVIPFQRQTEEQLFARIDRSLMQMREGMGEDLDDVVKEMMSEIEA